MWVLRTVVAGGLALWGAGCTIAESPARQYELEGQILAIRPAEREVLIRHGDIKGFMPGMSMPFKVRDPQLLDGRAPGDLVRASLMVTSDTAWIATLEKIGAAPLDEAADIPPAAFVEPVKPGSAVPALALTDHLGESLALPAWRGSAVAVTFIYIRCPLPQFCPLLDRRFAQIQRQILVDPKLAGRARLLSVSFDPDADTPAQLRAHANRLHADPAIWRFATAPREQVDHFAAHFGVNVIREPDGTITHNLRTAVIGPDGRVVRVYEGSEWAPDDIVADLGRALDQ